MVPSDFYPETYLELNPDVKKVFSKNEDVINHYLKYGIKENRIYKYSQIPYGFSLNYYFNWIHTKNSDTIYDKPFEGFNNSLIKINMPKIIYGVYFICCINNYLDIIKEQLNEVKQSGLYNDTTELLFFITLYHEDDNELKQILEEFDTQNKIKLITTPENLFEKYAIRNYKNYITTTEDYYIYYFHTKGVGKNDINNSSIFSKTRQILNFFTLNKYKISIELLEKYDAVGCSLYRYPKTHFSGNFWWSKKTHVIQLNDKIGDGYLAPEMYICSNSDGKYVSLNNNTNSGFVKAFIHSSDESILSDINENPYNNDWGKDLVIFC